MTVIQDLGEVSANVLSVRHCDRTAAMDATCSWWNAVAPNSLYFLVRQVSYTQCLPGFYALEADIDCKPCEKGASVPAPFRSPRFAQSSILCPGYYSNVIAADSCLPCVQVQSTPLRLALPRCACSPHGLVCCFVHRA